MSLSMLSDAPTRFGEIGDVYIPRARGTNESRGFAFVRFMQKRDAEEAIEAMEGKDFQGRDLRVQFAKQRRPDNPREYYARNGGGDEDSRGGDRYDDRARGGDRYDDRGRGGDRYDDRRGGDRYDDRRGGGDRYGDRPRRHSRSRSPRRDHHRSGGGRDRSRSRHRSRSPPRHRSGSPPRRD